MGLGMDISRLDPDTAGDAELAAYVEFKKAVFAVDRPLDPHLSYEDAIGRLRMYIPDRELPVHWLATRGGRCVGHAAVSFAQAENSKVAVTDISVRPDWRRQGVGTALLRSVLPAIREAGRTVVAGAIIVATPGPQWAQAMGFRAVYRCVGQHLVLAEADPALWDVAEPEGYHLVRWSDRTPDELLESYARARTAITDAPTHDSTLRFPVWTPERVREEEAGLRRNRYENLVVVAVHDATGDVAGLTQVEIAPDRPRAGQLDTAVLPAHRGHGLGRCVKAAMSRWIRADYPRVADVCTSNATDNVHMLSINKEVGYTVLREIVDVEADLASLEERFA